MMNIIRNHLQNRHVTNSTLVWAFFLRLDQNHRQNWACLIRSSSKHSQIGCTCQIKMNTRHPTQRSCASWSANDSNYDFSAYSKLLLTGRDESFMMQSSKRYFWKLKSIMISDLQFQKTSYLTVVLKTFFCVRKNFLTKTSSAAHSVLTSSKAWCEVYRTDFLFRRWPFEHRWRSTNFHAIHSTGTKPGSREWKSRLYVRLKSILFSCRSVNHRWRRIEVPLHSVHHKIAKNKPHRNNVLYSFQHYKFKFAVQLFHTFLSCKALKPREEHAKHTKALEMSRRPSSDKTPSLKFLNFVNFMIVSSL